MYLKNKKTAAIKPKIELTAEVLVRIACACRPRAPEATGRRII